MKKETREERDLYDINRNLTGEKIYKGDKIPNNRYILVVLAFIQNSDGEFLIQKRSKEKNGKYATTGGHPKSGESSIQGIITEIKEEVGLDVKEEEAELIYSGIEEKNQELFDVYYIKKDFEINDLKLQKEEVELVRFLTIYEIKMLMKCNMFFENHSEEVFRMIDILKEKGINI